MPGSFDAVKSLGESALRGLLDSSDSRNDSRDRLWAIWALALRGSPDVAKHLEGEPSAGVRRHMCIVLAGTELDLLVAMARHDSDVDVRATAAGLVVRLAGGGRLPWDLGLQMLRDEAPEVRASALREVPSGAPPEALALVVGAAGAEHVGAAREALATLLRVDHARGLALLATRLTRATDAEAGGLVEMCLDHVREPKALHEALLFAEPGVRLIVMRHLQTRWSDLEAFASDPDPAVREATRQRFKGRMHEVARGALVPLFEDEPGVDEDDY